MTNNQQIGSAVYVGNYENGSPEWHELRKTGIGGSDIAALCGVSPWTSPFALWAKKTGKIDDASGTSEVMEWGNLLEPVIIERLSQHYGYNIKTDVGTWAHPKRPWQLANPDGLIMDDDTADWGILEIKTSRFEDGWGSVAEDEIGDASGVPVHYRTQVQWYMQTFDLSFAIVAVLFGGSKLRRYRVEQDLFEQSVNLRKAIEMKQLIETDTQPQFDGALSTLETVRAIHPDIVDDEVELGDLWQHADMAFTAEKQATQHANEMKARVLDALGSAKRGVYDFGEHGGVRVVCERSSRMGGRPFLKLAPKKGN